jgi:hypothetical protein
MIPGTLNVSDGSNTVNISTPGFQSVVFEWKILDIYFYQ